MVETAYSLEDRVGIKLGPVVVNGVFPELNGLADDPLEAAADAGVVVSSELSEALAAAASFRLDRQSLQERQLTRLGKELPLNQINLPFVFRSDLGLDSLRDLAGRLAEQIAHFEAVPT